MKEKHELESQSIIEQNHSELAQELSGGVSGEMIITPGMPQLIRTAGAEGCVLLKNNGLLPLNNHNCVSVFGRVQNDYFCVGYGSGGDVVYPYKINLMDGLRNNGNLRINEELAAIYEKWCMNNKAGNEEWGNWPRYYPEMPLQDEMVKNASENSEVALIEIGRAHV